MNVTRIKIYIHFEYLTLRIFILIWQT